MQNQSWFFLTNLQVDVKDGIAEVLRNPSSGTYDIKEWQKAFLSQPEEFNYFIDEKSIDGEIPADLCGSLFRNRPGLFERGTATTI